MDDNSLRDQIASASDPAAADALKGSRPERRVRKRLPLWDRVKFLVLLAALFTFVVAADVSGNPILTWSDAVRMQAESSWWILALAGAELVRQLHMFVGERWSGYYLFWTETVFGRAERRLLRLNDWNRFRVSRALKWAATLSLFVFIYARVRDLSIFDAVVDMPSALWDAMPFVIQIVVLLLVVVGQFVAIFWFLSRGGVDVYFPEDVKTRFSDVWGQDHVVSRVRENVFYLEKPEEIESRGGYVPGGILLYGPPGTGKTLIAEAVAGETGKPYVFVDPGAFRAMFFGVGVMKVKSLFRKLRKLALRYGGVIVFFDEADTLGNRGQISPGFGRGAAAAGTGGAHLAASSSTDGLGGGCNGIAYLNAAARADVMHPFVVPGGGGGMANMDGTLQALLTEMSGLKKPRGFLNRVVRRALGMRPKPPPKYRILIMMATNMPQSLDEALLRPGRLDRQYKVGYPSKEGRVRTFDGYLAKVRHELTPEQVERLAVMSPHATGATIKDTVNEALVQAVKDGREVITWRDMMRARIINEHGLPDDHDYIEAERHSVALHEACHAVVAYRLQRNHVIDLATIERRGDIGGFVSGVAVEDRMFTWNSEVETQVMVALASLAGERMFFDGDNTAGVGGDLRAATLLVSLHISATGFGRTLASRMPMIERGLGESSIDNDRPFGEQVEAKLRELYARTEEVLADNRRELLAVAHALETHKTITGEDVEAIIEGTVGTSVDGRRYHEPEFVSVAEAYHLEALRAHHGESTEALELPDLRRAAATTATSVPAPPSAGPVPAGKP